MIIANKSYDQQLGKDLPMFSRSGKQTIPMHKPFQTKISDRKKVLQHKRDEQRLKELEFYMMEQVAVDNKVK